MNGYKLNKNQTLNPIKKTIPILLKTFKKIPGWYFLGVCFPVINV
jgi:hypothetical protein